MVQPTGDTQFQMLYLLMLLIAIKDNRASLNYTKLFDELQQNKSLKTGRWK